MTYTVSITRQGQMSIPASIRKQLSLKNKPKASVSVQNGKIVVEPVGDFMDLAGTFRTKKKYDPKKAREEFEWYLATRHLGNKLT